MKKSFIITLLGLFSMLLTLGVPSAQAAPVGKLPVTISMSMPYNSFYTYPLIPQDAYFFRFSVRDASNLLPVPAGNVGTYTVDGNSAPLWLNAYHYQDEFIFVTGQGNHTITVHFNGSPIFAPATRTFTVITF